MLTETTTLYQLICYDAVGLGSMTGDIEYMWDEIFDSREKAVDCAVNYCKDLGK